MMKSLFNKVAGLQAWHVIKETPKQVLSCEYCEVSKNNYFEEYMQTATSESFAFTVRVAVSLLNPKDNFLHIYIFLVRSKLLKTRS